MSLYADQIAVEQPERWEALLAAETLREALEGACRGYEKPPPRDRGVASVLGVRDTLDFVLTKARELETTLSNLQAGARQFVAAAGAGGGGETTVGVIHRFAGCAGAAAAGFLRWENDFAALRPHRRLQECAGLMAGWGGCYFTRLQRMADLCERLGRGQPVADAEWAGLFPPPPGMADTVVRLNRLAAELRVRNVLWLTAIAALIVLAALFGNML